jgi:hypothetical protein
MISWEIRMASSAVEAQSWRKVSGLCAKGCGAGMLHITQYQWYCVGPSVLPDHLAHTDLYRVVLTHTSTYLHL